MTDHTRIEELLAVRALGGLDEDDARALDTEMASHGPDCAGCRDLERGFGEAAASLAMELEPVPLRAGFEEQVMAAARAARPPAAPTGAAPASVRTGEVVRLERPASPWSRRLGALAVAAALLLGGFAVGRLTSEDGPPMGFFAYAAILHLDGDAPGSISVAYRPGEAGGYLIGTDVPEAADDAVYALWTITGDTPTLVGCFTPHDGELDAAFDQDVSDADLMAITVEPPACPPAPTTAPILSGEIVTA
jgi:hypothetical protein